ncbi:hypothetical protein [Actinomadura rupiterrae]|uniref:hypothetical protein n=1 Tax=Actinomadura rupiterrae TaxID=559627 RepID=UPI0020A5573B|nr:hypothetical protein [Actinomadura rupiterrae]MCP2337889.1 hypothetical protein [Actinomadura rupiterrae]
MSSKSLSTTPNPTSETAPAAGRRMDRILTRLGALDAFMLAGIAAGALWLLATGLLMMSTGPAIVLSLAVGIGAFGWTLAQIDRRRTPADVQDPADRPHTDDHA